MFVGEFFSKKLLTLKPNFKKIKINFMLVTFTQTALLKTKENSQIYL